MTALPVAVALATPKDDWPHRNGELWLNTHDRDEAHTGTRRNDELLGGHGDDTVKGGWGHDVIWGDHKASGNTEHQLDRIYGGPGQDTIRVWFGRGFVDCGPGGNDILYVSKTQNHKVKRRNCERVSHKSARVAVHDRDHLRYP